MARGPVAGLPPRLLESSRTAVLVVAAPPGHAVAKAARKALREPELVDLELGLLELDPARQAARFAEVRAAVAGAPRLGWVLLAPKGTVLGKGTEAPSAPVLAAVLAGAGIQAPIKVLQAFLRTHPDHLEAREDLLRLLRRGAAARTRARLGLVGKTRSERLADGEPVGIAATAEAMPDLLPYEGKRLKEREDLELWAAYAQELDRVFQDGSWRSLDLGLDPSQELPVEVCSPMMQTLYLRHLPKVEATLATLPDAPALWQIWLRMTAVSGSNRSRALVQGLTLPPPEFRMVWPPPGVVGALVRDAQQHGNWWLVRDLLEPFWVGWKAQVERERALGGRTRTGLSADWAGSLGPLLESMIRGAAEGEAQELVNALAMIAETRPLVARAVALANACQRPDLARRWAGLGR